MNVLCAVSFKVSVYVPVYYANIKTCVCPNIFMFHFLKVWIVVLTSLTYILSGLSFCLKDHWPGLGRKPIPDVLMCLSSRVRSWLVTATILSLTMWTICRSFIVMKWTVCWCICSSVMFLSLILALDSRMTTRLPCFKSAVFFVCIWIKLWLKRQKFKLFFSFFLVLF